MALKDLTDILAREVGLPASRSYQIVTRYHELIEKTLARDGTVLLAHVGVLSVRHCAAREHVNPATGTRSLIPERTRVGFRAAKVEREMRLG